MDMLAEKAGIDPSQQEDAGWGRTFARWAWPFGEEAGSQSPEAILEDEYEEAEDASPWWWPFWSETSSAEISPTPESAESDTPKAVAEKENQETPEESDRSIRDWVWPF